MAETKENKELLLEDQIRTKILEGARDAYTATVVSYGPRGKNVLLEKGFGRPILSRDGVTIVRDVYFKDRAKNMGAQLIIEASETTNRIAGDGTTATVALSYHLLNNGIKAIASGIHPMVVKDSLIEDSRTILKKLEELAKPVKDEQLKEVATVSSGDPLIGELIADAILYVGKDGGIVTEKSPINEVEREYIDGYYLQSGFTALQGGKKEIIDPFVIISSKRITSSADMLEVITKAAKSQGVVPGSVPKFLFIGNFEEAAYMTIVDGINRGMFDAVVLKTPPQFGEMGKSLLADIAMLAGCQPITDSTSLKNFDGSFVGKVDKVSASKSESTIFADREAEDVQVRIAELKEQIENEPVDAISEKLRDRLAKLEGKVALFRIGGATDTEREELEFRVEDAINSTRNAHNEGIVAGGGITLLELSKLDISDMFRDALRDTFKQLLLNANFPAELKLNEALNAKPGYGFNLRKSDELVDVVKDGVVDPVVVTREVIKNSSGAIGNALTVGGALIFTDSKEK